MSKNLFSFFIFSVLLISACNTKRDVQINTGELYLDYAVNAEEGNDNVTVLLQFRDGGEDEDGIYTGASTAVSLDGEPILPDSTAIGGIFYEVHKPLTEFRGKHIILFKNAAGKELVEEFNFEPLALTTAIRDTLVRGELGFEFSGLESGDRVRVLLTDTSFINDGINRIEKVKDSRVVIPAASLNRVANGPVQLEFIREYERPLRMAVEGSGHLRITYSLKREFFLADAPGAVDRGGLQRIYTLK